LARNFVFRNFVTCTIQEGERKSWFEGVSPKDGREDEYYLKKGRWNISLQERRAIESLFEGGKL
jgi:hypothetical protein